jgi:2-dehydropantoate 2-reductase
VTDAQTRTPYSFRCARVTVIAMRVAVLGIGGVGGLVAALLSRAGDTVTCLGRESTVATLSAHGLRLTSTTFGTFSTEPEADVLLTHAVDACVVAVKAPDLEAALERLPSHVLGNALLVPLLNGFEHVAELRRRYPDAFVVPAAMRVSASRAGPGEISHDSPFATIDLASPAGASRDAVVRFAEQLGAAGFQVTVRDDEAGVLWQKLVFLVPLALLTTYEQAPAGVVRERRRDDLRAIIGEVAAVADADGAPQNEQGVLDFFDSVPAAMQSSMQRDAAAGRPTELDAIGGAVVRCAARHGVAVPVTARYVDELRARASQRSAD